MKHKLTTNGFYIGAMVLAVAAVGCGGAIEQCSNGWVMLAWTGAALVLGGVALVLAALGVSAEAENSRKVHKPQKNTVRPPRQNRRGA